MTLADYDKEIKDINNLIKGYKAKLEDLFVKREKQREKENGQISIEEVLK